MNKAKLSAVGKSLLWGICILLFPVFSGVLSAVLSLETVETLFLQGIFMLFSLVVPLLFVLTKKWSWNELGFAQIDVNGCKKAIWFLPLLAILVPAAIRGFYISSAAYLWGNLFLYLMVGIAEEIYFRGIIPMYLRKVFSWKEVIFLSAVIFGTGHIASAFTAGSGLEICLTVFNAFLFGWLAMEMTVICSHIMPAVLLHFLFDFETKIAVISGTELQIAEGIRGAVMVVAAVWLAAVLAKLHNSRSSGK